MGRNDPTREQARVRCAVALAGALFGSAAAAPAAAPDFDAFRAQLEKRCEPPRTGDSTPEVKAAEAAQEDCLRKAAVRELDAVLIPLKKGDPARFQALMREQAAWNEVKPLACTLLDEWQFLAEEHARWVFGTIVGLGQTACMQNAHGDRAYYAVTRQRGDAAAFAARVRVARPAAAEIRRDLAAFKRIRACRK